MSPGEDSLAAPPPAPCHERPPHRGAVLVLAPHPDDESAGPGGAVAAHVGLGDPVSVLFVTSGVHGDPVQRYDPDEYVALRRREAESACDRLGVGAREFWGLPDSCEVSRADLAAVTERLVDLFDRTRPDVVYAPHEGEAHSDHHFVALAARAAAARAAAPPVLLGYEVWSPMQAGFVLDVTDVYAAKRDAVRCYASQLDHTDILAAIEGLNTYRSILLPHNDGRADRRAEVYREMS